MRGGGSVGSIVGIQWTCAHVILVLRECIWNLKCIVNVSVSLEFSSVSGVLSPCLMAPPWVIASSLLAGNREVELKPTIFS